MGLESAADPQVAALLTLGRGAVNADLAAVLGVNAVDSVHGYPIPLGLLGKQTLPALAIYRGRHQWREARFGGGEVDTLVTIRIQYFSQATSREKLNERWPLLQLVEGKLFAALMNGHHPAVEDDENLLEAAGVMKVDPNTFVTDFAFVPGEGEFAYPGFQSSYQLTHHEPPDLSKLHELLAVDATYKLGDLAIHREVVQMPLTIDDDDDGLGGHE